MLVVSVASEGEKIREKTRPTTIFYKMRISKNTFIQICMIYTKVPHVKGRITGTRKEHAQVFKHVALIKWSKTG